MPSLFQGLLNAIMELMEEEEILDIKIHEFLKEDQALARRPLGEVATLKASQVHFDNFSRYNLNIALGMMARKMGAFKVSNTAGAQICLSAQPYSINFG